MIQIANNQSTRLGTMPGALIAAALAALTLPAAQATEAVFSETYLAETLPKGAKELEQWVSYRDKKSQGTYRLWQYRTEFEYGVTDRWTIAMYANSYAVTAQNNNSAASRNNYTAVGDGDEVTGGGPVTFGSHVPNLEALPVPSARYSKRDFESISLESTYQFMSPYKDSFGLAGYVELTGGRKTQELEFKLLAQKNLMEDDLILAANLVLGFEKEKWSGLAAEKETELQISGGASYRVAPGWRLGLEMRNLRAYEGGYSLASKNRDYSAWFAGPTLHYAAEKFFVTVGYMQQMPWATAYSPAARDELVGHRVYKDSEKHNLRVKVGLSF